MHRLAGEDVLIELAGELDGPGRRCLRDQVGELLGRGGCLVTVDVGGLRQIDIPALAALLRADLLLRRVRGSLQIRSATPAFLELIAATGLTGRLRLAPALATSLTGAPGPLPEPAVPSPSSGAASLLGIARGESSVEAAPAALG